MIPNNIQTLANKINSFLLNISPERMHVDISVTNETSLFNSFCRNLFELSTKIHEHKFNPGQRKQITDAVESSGAGQVHAPLCVGKLGNEFNPIFSKLTTSQKNEQPIVQHSESQNFQINKSLAKLLEKCSYESDFSFQQCYTPLNNIIQYPIDTPSTHHRIRNQQILTLTQVIAKYEQKINAIVDQIMGLPYQQYIDFMAFSALQNASTKHQQDHDESTSSILHFRDQIEEIIFDCKRVYEQIIKQNDDVDLGSHSGFSDDDEYHPRQSALTKMLKNSILAEHTNQNERSTKIQKTKSPRKTKHKKLPNMQLLSDENTKLRRKQIKVKKQESCGSCSQQCTIF